MPHDPVPDPTNNAPAARAAARSGMSRRGFLKGAGIDVH